MSECHEPQATPIDLIGLGGTSGDEVGEFDPVLGDERSQGGHRIDLGLRVAVPSADGLVEPRVLLIGVLQNEVVQRGEEAVGSTLAGLRRLEESHHRRILGDRATEPLVEAELGIIGIDELVESLDEAVMLEVVGRHPPSVAPGAGPGIVRA